MKAIKFILHKIIIVETMLIILFFICNLFGVSISIVDLIIGTGLKYLTPVAIVALVGYIIISLFSFKIIEIFFGILMGLVLVYYIFYR